MNILTLITLPFLAAVVNADCGPPTVIADTTNNSTGSENNPNGTVLYYQCNIGYRQSGTSNIYRCNGTHWLGDYSCEKITCAYVEPPSNGRVTNHPSYDIGTQIQFECNVGYNMVGHHTHLCMADGSWDPDSTPVCNAVNCGEFYHVSYGHFYKLAGGGAQNDYGRVVQVVCNDRYILTGSSHVSCQADGTWGKRPTCVRDECPSHPGIENSTCVDSVDLASSGAFVDLYCQEDSVSTVGGGSAYCNNGVWDDLDISCHCDCRVEFNSDLVEIHNLNNKGFVPHGVSLDWECKHGGTKNTSETLVCRDGVIATPVCIGLTSTTLSTTVSTTTQASTTPSTSGAYIEQTTEIEKTSHFDDKSSSNNVQTSTILSTNPVEYSSTLTPDINDTIETAESGYYLIIISLVCFLLVTMILICSKKCC